MIGNYRIHDGAMIVTTRFNSERARNNNMVRSVYRRRGCFKTKMACTACPMMLRAQVSARRAGWGDEKHAHSVIFIQAKKSKPSEPVSSAVAMNDPSRTRFDACPSV